MKKNSLSRIDLRAYIAQGWTAMFILFVANLVMDMSRCQVIGSCQQWADHLGMGGIVFVTMVMVVYTVVPLLVRSVTANWIRFLVVPLSMLITMFYVAHQVSHLAANDKPMGLIHALDFTHHFVGITVIVASIMWLRSRHSDQTEAGAMGEFTRSSSTADVA